DARFCREVCRALKIEFVSERWQRPRLRPEKTSVKNRPTKPVSEAEARAARQAFFAAHARVVWLGHQQDDIAETMLMRLARGSGLGGLAAPRPVQALSSGRTHLRPLLTLKKAALIAALRAAGIPWREDSTNAAGDFFRNRIRRDILPAWAEAARRDALAGAARSRALLEEDEAALDGWVDRLAPLDPRGGLILSKLDGEPRAIVRRALHRWVLAQRRPIEVSSQAFEALLTAVEVGRPTRHSLGAECFGEIAGGALRLVSGGKLRRKFHRGVN
ncbi:MAG TPA: tRNA lysidine(34) synthetase TilS, partial [Opitutaceae bacterium]